MINQITSGHVWRKNHITPDIVTLQTINVVQIIVYSTQIKPQAFLQSTLLFAVRVFFIPWDDIQDNHNEEVDFHLLPLQLP